MDRRLFLGLGFCALAGCASPVVQSPGTPPMGFRGPRLEDRAMVSFDGERLPMMVWPATDASGRRVKPSAVIVALHGFDDYAKAFALAGPYWAKRGITTYAYDQRGFGRTADRGLWGGERPMDEDLRTACALIRARHPNTTLAVAGESMGGAIAISALASDRPPDADRAILLSPAVWGWGQQPLTNKVGLWVLAHTDPSLALEPPSFISDQHKCSDNDQILKQMDDDPNEIAATRADATYGLVNLMGHARKGIGKLKVPTLYLYGAHDLMIPKEAAFEAAAAMGPNARTAYYPDGWHLLDRDLHADRVLADVASFTHNPTAPLPSSPPAIPKLGQSA